MKIQLYFHYNKKITMNKSICVIGAGYWGKNHIKTLNQLNVLKGIVEQDKAILKCY